MSNIEKNIRDVLSKEKSDKGLARLDDDFFSSAYGHLSMLRDGWKGMTRGDSEVERSYRKWKITKSNIGDIYISRLRKILTMVNQKIDGRNPNLSHLVPEERTLFCAMAFIALKNRKIMVEQSTSERGVLEDIIYLMKSDPDGNQLFDTKEPFLRGHSYIAENLPSTEEFVTPPSHIKDLEDDRYLTDFDSYQSPEDKPEAEGEESVIVPYEEYSGKDLGEGDIEAAPDPVEPDGKPLRTEMISIDHGHEPENDNGAVDGYVADKDDDDHRTDPDADNIHDHGADDVSNNGIEMTTTGHPPDESRALLIRILEDTGSFVSPHNGITYDLKKNEVISFPYYVANILVDAKKAEPIE